MNNVLVYELSDESGWVATEWPQQRYISSVSANREDAAVSYVEVFNSTTGQQTTAEDYRFFGPLLVTAEVEEVQPGYWRASASADQLYLVTSDTEESVKADFIDLWNRDFVDPNGGEHITDINVDWQVVE